MRSISGFSGFQSFHLPLFRQIDALDVAGGLADEIGADERGIGERVNAECKPVALQADAANHFFVRTQIEILIVLSSDCLFASFPGKMAGGAAYPRADGSVPGEFVVPAREMLRIFIRETVAVVVACEAGIHRRPARIEIVRAVATGAGEIAVSRFGFHWQPGFAGRHRRKPSRQGHPMLPSQKSVDLLLVALGARCMAGMV